MLEKQAMSKVPMTPEGFQKLQGRLKALKTTGRREMAKSIEMARGHGDLSENAEYDAAKEAQAQLEIEIKNLEDNLARAEVIDPTQFNHTKVTFGATVTLEDCEAGTQVTYQIVGEVESDIKLGKISVQSPIGKALIGKEAGDVAEVHTPRGRREFEVLAIQYK